MIIKKMNEEIVLELLDDMFEIISNNMKSIYDTKNTIEEDYKIWKNSMLQELKNQNKRWIGAFIDNNLIGYFLYRVENTTVYLDEIELKPERQGDKITFISLMKELFNETKIKDNYQVKLYVNSNNKKSQHIVSKLGFKEYLKTKNGIKYNTSFSSLKNKINNYH